MKPAGLLLSLLPGALLASAQSNTTSNNNTSSASPSPSFTLTTVFTTLSPAATPGGNGTASYSGNVTGTRTALVFTVLPSATPSATTSVNSSSSTNSTLADSTPSLNPIGVDPTYGILGVLLLLSSLPLALLGPKLRLYTPLLLTSHLLSLTTLILILHFGVQPNLALSPPSPTLRGLYLLSCLVAGGVGAGLAALGREWAAWGCGAMGGFALACWVEAWRSGGVVQGSWRWALYAGFMVGGFVLCTVRQVHVGVMVASSAAVGASGIMLGIDCFTAAGLKEFYIANLGFTSLFPQLPPSTPTAPIPPLTQPILVELALTGLLTLVSIAVQLRVVPLLKAARERQAEARAREEREQEEEKARVRLEEEFVQREREEWEARHGTGSSRPRTWAEKEKEKEEGRPSSQFSLLPFVPYRTGSNSHSNSPAPSTRSHSHNHSDFSHPNPHSRTMSLSTPLPSVDYFSSGSGGGGKTSAEVELHPAVQALAERRRAHSLGPLPALELGAGGDAEPLGSLGIPGVASATPSNPSAAAVDEELKGKLALLDEIRTIRASIAALKSETTSGTTPPPAAAGSRTSSISTSTTPAPFLSPPSVHSQPPPARTDEWDAYLRQRRLVVPPSVGQGRVRQSEAVRVAMEGRRRRESMLELGMVADPDVGMDGGRGERYQAATMPVGEERVRRASAYESSPLHLSPAMAERYHAATMPVADERARRASAYDLAPRPPPPPSPSPHLAPADRRASTLSTPTLYPRPPQPPRTLTTSQLETRHREALRALQASAHHQPTSTSSRPQEGRGRRKSAGEIERMAEREREREVPFPSGAAGRRRAVK